MNRMFGIFKHSSGRKGAKPSLNAIHFDTTGYAPQEEHKSEKIRVWHTPDGDGLGVFLFLLPPDLPANASSVDELAAHYRQSLVSFDGKLVNLDVILVESFSAIRAVISVPQHPSGRTYIGSITLPFRDFSFVIKCQCAERGTTGLREATLLDRSLAVGNPMKIENGKFDIFGWNPDSEVYDTEFPSHPLTRVRCVLDHVAKSLTLDKQLLEMSRFVLPHVQA